MMKQPLTQAEFDSIYSKVPRLNVEIIIFLDQSIVLSKRSIEPCLGQWHIPGGTVYFGETIEDTVKRVAKDELGVGVSILKQAGIIQYPMLFKDGYSGWPIGVAFEVKIVSGDLHGSYQGEEVSIFSELPANTVADQRIFLIDTYPKIFM